MSFLDLVKQLAKYGKCDTIPAFSKDDPVSHKELYKLHDIITAPHVALALVALQNSGFFDFYIPEIKNSLNLTCEKSFKEIWPHTIKVVNNTPNNIILRWAALFHDLGKAQVFEIIDDKVTFHNHEYISSKIFNQFAKRTFIFNKEQKDKINFLVKNLGYVEGYDYSWTDSAVRRFIKETGDNTYLLITLSIADITTSNPKRKIQILNRVDDLKNRIVLISKKDSEQNLLPKGMGKAISEIFNIPLGQEIGNIRKQLEDKIKAGILLPKQEIDYYIEELKHDR